MRSAAKLRDCSSRWFRKWGVSQIMRVLLVSSEVYPLIKTGGLADVAGTLPPALRRHDVDVRVILPAYPAALEVLSAAGQGRLGEISLGDVLGYGETRLLEGTLPGSDCPVWLIDNPGLYQRPGGPYVGIDGGDHPDNHRRFALLSKVAAMVGCGAVPGWRPEIVHCNDWQTGLVPAYLHLSGLAGRQAELPKTVFTIHNLHFGGFSDPSVMAELGLPTSFFSINGLEFYGRFSMLKAGLFYADRVTTVSPTYAWEITTPEGGRGFDGLLAGRAHAGHLAGILNGVDYEQWDSRTDPALVAPYDAASVAKGKAANKAAVQAEFGLDARPDALLLGLVSRFTDQKGVDLVLDAARFMVDSGAQLVLLGSGDLGLEQALAALPHGFPGQIAVRIGYDEALSHRIQAASDVFLVPSRFEPCGLTQMYALRYGALPLVRRTGGLADTVSEIGEGRGTGFLFDAPTVEGLLGAFYHALGVYRRPDDWAAARQRAMAQDFGWDRAALQYLDLFRSLMASGA